MAKWLIAIVLLGCFNALFFSLVDISSSGVARWLAYGFVSLALLCPFILSAIKYRCSEVHATMLVISGIYAVMEFIAGVVIMLINPVGYTASLVIQLILFCVALVAYISYYKLDRTNNNL